MKYIKFTILYPILAISYCLGCPGIFLATSETLNRIKGIHNEQR